MDKPKPRSARTPTPVRAAMEGVRPDRPGAAPEPEERRLDVDGRELIVRVQGRGVTGLAPGSTPLLLLGFFTDDGEEPERESLVAAPSLEAADEEVLVRAWEDGVQPKGKGEPADLFADSVGDRRRGR